MISSIIISTHRHIIKSTVPSPIYSVVSWQRSRPLGLIEQQRLLQHLLVVI